MTENVESIPEDLEENQHTFVYFYVNSLEYKEILEVFW